MATNKCSMSIFQEVFSSVSSCLVYLPFITSLPKWSASSLDGTWYCQARTGQERGERKKWKVLGRRPNLTSIWLIRLQLTMFERRVSSEGGFQPTPPLKSSTMAFLRKLSERPHKKWRARRNPHHMSRRLNFSPDSGVQAPTNLKVRHVREGLCHTWF